MKMLAFLFVLVLPLCAGSSNGEIVIVYDNTSIERVLKEDWGFGAVVNFHGRHLLFDTGTRAEVLLDNLQALKIDPGLFEQVVISHAHLDHFGGLFSVWQQNSCMSVHFFDVFPAQLFSEAEAAGIRPNRVTGPFQLAPLTYSTGVVEGTLRSNRWYWRLRAASCC